MISGGLPLISVFERLINPCIIIGTLLAVTLLAGVSFDGYYLVLAIITFFISSKAFDRVSLLRSWRKMHFAVHGRGILIAWLIVIGLLLFLGYATKLSDVYSRPTLLIWFIITPVVLILSHVIARYIICKRISLRDKQRTVVIVGASELGLQLASRIASDPYLGVEVKGFFDDRSPERLSDTVNPRLPLLGRMCDLPDYVTKHRISTVYLTLPMMSQPRIVKLLDDLHDTTVSIYFVPDIFVFEVIQARFESINGIPVVALCETPLDGVNGILKSTNDLFLASVILLLLSPLILLIAAGIKLSSPGPVLFKQRRYGLDGEQILVYKFRTMNVLEDGNDIRQAKKEDKRITPFGALLRKTSLDELPQFLNVLQGRMSIVGPRPHAVAHNEMYRKDIKGYMIRHKVKPGITGWAQVNGLRGETQTVEKMKARVEYDLDYLRNWSLSLDLWIILRTVLIVFKDQNAY